MFVEWIVKKVMNNEVYCIKFNKYCKFENHKISHIFCKTLVLSMIWDKCISKDEAIFKEDESIEILKTLGFIIDMEEY